MGKRSDEEESPSKKQKRFLALPEFVDPDQLKAQILDSNAKVGQDYLIIDVRSLEERQENGWIPNSINIPSVDFEENLKVIQDEYHSISCLYFHCALSQVRGPKCAQKYVTAINQSEAHKMEQSIFILRGGFEEWKGLFGLDKRLAENVSFGY